MLGCALFGCVILGLGSHARALDPECTTAICAGDPCTITGTHLLTNPCDLDFGTKNVTIAPSAKLETGDVGSFSIEARRFTLQGMLNAPAGGSIDITTTEDFVTGGGRSSGRIRADGDLGTVTVTAGGSATLGGTDAISASNGDSYSGTIRITAASVTLSQEVAADGQGTDGGEIEITATSGSIATTKQLHADATGGYSVAGTVTLTAPGDITIGGQMSADGGRGAAAGSINLAAGGGITINALVSADGGTGGGSGGTVTMNVQGNATIAAPVRTRGRGDGAEGGTIEIDATPRSAVVVSDTLDATTSATGNFNGTIIIGPACTVVVTGTLDTQGDAGAGINMITYHQSLNVTGGHLRADPILPGGNFIACRCVGDNDGVCDGGCVAAPVGLGQSTADPPATITPKALGPCIGCPNGHVDEDVGEVCDDGNFVDGDGCESDCTLSCGNGVVTGTEECDDGNTVDGDCCSATCQREAELDVDANGQFELATDVVYIARRFLGLAPVPPSFRREDPTIPTDRIVAGRVDALGLALDFDRNGAVEIATDVVYIARILLGLAPVPPSFRVTGSTIPPDAVIAANVSAVCRTSGPNLPPCTSARYPTCAGECPAGNTCYAVSRSCVCAPTDVPCATDGSTCGGMACPLGQGCFSFGPLCGCSTPSP